MTPRRLVAAVTLLALACSADDAPRAVLARVADGTLESVPAASVRKVTLGTRTRDGIRADAGTSFEIVLPEASERLALSLGVPGRPPCLVPVRHLVSAVGDSESPVLLDETPNPEEARWHDVELDLTALSPRPERLRFEIRPGFVDEAQSRACAGQVRSWWGSLLAIGPDAAPCCPGDRWRDDAALPSVVLISLDTLGAGHLSSFGGPADVSPRLDALLAESFSFRRAIAQYGHTRPSTASLFSAVYPHRHGAYPDDLLARFDSLVPVLARAGYRSVAFTEGAYVSAAFGSAEGFDEYDDGVSGTETASRADALDTFGRAAQWIESHGTTQRFFLFLHTYEVHIPYLPRDAESLAVASRLTPGVDRFFTRSLQIRAMLDHNRGGRSLDADEIAHLRALHVAEIHYLDRVLGLLLDRLAELGLERDTLLVVTSDHGDQFGEAGRLSHGETLHNLVHHVPLGFRWPARIAAGTSDTPVQLVDVMPSVLDLVGIDPPAGVDGRSLARAVHGAAPLEARPAFSELRSPPGECERLGIDGPCRLGRLAVQNARFKLSVSEHPAAEALYDLDSDPLEERDVSAEHPEALAELRRALAEYRRAQAPGQAAASATPPVLDESLRRQLESLGYLAPGGADSSGSDAPGESSDAKN